MKNIFIKILLISTVIILFSEITNYLFNYKKLIYNSLAEKLTINQLNNIFDFQEKWKYITYVFVIILILVKTFTISCILHIGIFFYTKREIDFKDIWIITTKSEFIFLLIGAFKIIWFYFFETNYNLKDIQYFFPFSVLNIIGHNGLEPWLIYPLQVLNFFEFVYIIYLSYQIGYLTNTNPDNGLKIVCYSYVSSLLLWVTVVMFLTLNFS